MRKRPDIDPLLAEIAFQSDFRASRELVEKHIINNDQRRCRLLIEQCRTLKEQWFDPVEIKWHPLWFIDNSLTVTAVDFLTLWIRVNAAHYILHRYVSVTQSLLRIKITHSIELATDWIVDCLVHGACDWVIPEHLLDAGTEPSYYVDDDALRAPKHRVLRRGDTPTAYLKDPTVELPLDCLSANQRMLWERYRATPLTVELFEASGQLEWEFATHGDDDFDQWQPFEFAFDPELHSTLLRLLLCINSVLALRQLLSGDYRAVERTHFELQRLLASFVQCMYHCTRELGITEECAEHWWDCEFFLGEDGDARPSVLDRFYPGDLCGFWAGDLPNLSHVLPHLDCWRSNAYNEDFQLDAAGDDLFIGHLLIKSLTFCSMSRGFIKRIIDFCKGNRGSWLFLSNMFWCSLAGLFPPELGQRQPTDMNELLDLYALTRDRDRFIQALRKGKQGEMTALVFVPFRQYLFYLLSFNDHWEAAMGRLIDLPLLRQHTVKMGDTVRVSLGLASTPAGDPLFYARQEAFQYQSLHKLDVVRLHKHDYVRTILGHLNDERDARLVKHAALRREYRSLVTAANTLFQLHDGSVTPEAHRQALEALLNVHKVEEYWPQDIVSAHLSGQLDVAYAMFLERPAQSLEWTEKLVTYYRRVIKATGWELPRDIALNQVNYVLRATRDERFMFENLQSPALGFIEPYAVTTLYSTLETYREKGHPSRISMFIKTLSWRDWVVIDHYFRVLSLIDDIEYAPLHPEMQAQIERAMMEVRYPWLGPNGQPPPYAYKTFITLCCHPERRVSCYSDPQTYGNHLISYDTDRRNFVCGAKRKRPSDVRDLERVQTATHARTHRRKLRVIPCNNTALMIDLHGRALLMDGKRYQHCPTCATLHQYHPLGWGHDGYKCLHCRRQDYRTHIAPDHRCFYCNAKVTNPENQHILVYGACDTTAATTTGQWVDPNRGPYSTYQIVDVCASHHKLIGRAHEIRDIETLKNTIQKRNAKRRRRNQIRYNR